MIAVQVKCIACQATRWVGPGEVPKGELPMCVKCGAPQYAVSASADLGDEE